jgi:hypothetical protein
MKSWAQIELEDCLKQRHSWPRLGPSSSCVECGKVLSDPGSVKRGYGVDCAPKVIARLLQEVK